MKSKYFLMVDGLGGTLLAVEIDGVKYRTDTPGEIHEVGPEWRRHSGYAGDLADVVQDDAPWQGKFQNATLSPGIDRSHFYRSMQEIPSIWGDYESVFRNLTEATYENADDHKKAYCDAAYRLWAETPTDSETASAFFFELLRILEIGHPWEDQSPLPNLIHLRDRFR